MIVFLTNTYNFGNLNDFKDFLINYFKLFSKTRRHDIQLKETQQNGTLLTGVSGFISCSVVKLIYARRHPVITVSVLLIVILLNVNL
jgi:hypothetical protein